VNSKKRLGLLFVLVGPGGVGKNTLMHNALAKQENLRQLPTATTRNPRPGEQEGREHLFVSEEQFRQMISQDQLLEWQEVHPGRFYGVPRFTVERAMQDEIDLIADIEVVGASILRSAYPDNAVLIFIAPSGQDDDTAITLLRRRMEDRGDNLAEIEKRLQRARMEMAYAPTCDYLIVNEQIEDAALMLNSIIVAERSRRALLNLRASANLPRHRINYSVEVQRVTEWPTSLATPHAEPLLRGRILRGELPHEAAVRLLKAETATVAGGRFVSAMREHAGFIAPSGVRQVEHEYFDDLIYEYTYLVEANVQPNWVSVEQG
jgi:guanylate kinase